MPMKTKIIETDYLIIGSGAVGMAFADTLFHETQCHMVIVDKHHGPGGHWNDAYSFVRLHQPSAFYGVNSRELGGEALDASPLNYGMRERASSAQIIDYYEQVMQVFLASGRVTYLPMSSYDFSQSDGDGLNQTELASRQIRSHQITSHIITSQITGDTTEVRVRKKLVDTTYLNTAVPSTHPPQYKVGAGVRCVPLNDLPKVKSPPSGYVVVGAGKTGIDACLWLLENNVAADKICWIMPRDSWFQNRANVQPGLQFFAQTFGALALQMEAIGKADSLSDLLHRLEADEQLLRLDPTIEPSMYHAAVVSQAELTELRKIKNVVRLGRIQRIDANAIVLDEGSVPSDPERLYVDCSATAAQLRPIIPVFAGNKITPQFVRAFQPTFSAAFIAHVESTFESEAEKNLLCSVVPLPDKPVTWLTMQGINMANQFRWNSNKDLGRWILQSRLDGFSATSRAIAKDDDENMAVLTRFRNAAMAAAMKIPVLIAKVNQPSN